MPVRAERGKLPHRVPGERKELGKPAVPGNIAVIDTFPISTLMSKRTPTLLLYLLSISIAVQTLNASEHRGVVTAGGIPMPGAAVTATRVMTS